MWWVVKTIWLEPCLQKFVLLMSSFLHWHWHWHWHHRECHVFEVLSVASAGCCSSSPSYVCVKERGREHSGKFQFCGRLVFHEMYRLVCNEACRDNSIHTKTDLSNVFSFADCQSEFTRITRCPHCAPVIFTPCSILYRTHLLSPYHPSRWHWAYTQGYRVGAMMYVAL